MSNDGGDLFEETQLKEWRGRLTAAVSGLFLFEAITGLIIYFGPFSVSAQVMVVLHTLLGVLFLVPYGVYQYRHWMTNRPRPFNQHKLLGYLSFGTMAVVAVSGVVLTVQAGWGRRISYSWDLLHLIGGLAATAFVVWHLAIIVVRHRRQGTDGDKDVRMRSAQNAFLGRAGALIGVLLLLVGAWAFHSQPLSLSRPFPDDYQLPYGDNPFSPSLAITSTGGALEPMALAGSERCGSGDCHTEIVAEWQPSAHRYAAMSPFFQSVQAAMAANNGPESTRYCGGCHDPIALFSGSKNLYSDDLSAHGYQEGVSCVVCHSIEKTDVRGNANYVIEPQERYLFELSEEPLTAWLGRFLVRAYPRHHLDSWSRDLYKEPEYCGACHKQFIDEEINNVGWVQLQNQYDNWAQSRWHVPDDATRSVTCRECHMRLVDSGEPAAGDPHDYNRSPDDGKHRSHRFIAANQYLPELLHLPGAEEHVELTEEWLRGETTIPEIADKWTTGATIPLDIIAPESARPGESFKLRVVALNNKAGHDFPTGPLDIIQAWIEVRVEDEDGNTIFESGTLDERNFLETETTVFKAEAIDQYGNLIDKHNLWEMVGARFKRTLFPGYSDVALYSVFCPDQRKASDSPAASGTDGDQERMALPPTDAEVDVPETPRELVVTARLKYRKVDQYLINFLFPDSEMTAPITEMSVATARIPVVAEEDVVAAAIETGNEGPETP